MPATSMPGPVRWFAENRPVSSIVNSLRAVLTQRSVGSDLPVALAWCVALLLVAYHVAMVVFSRRRG